MKKFIKKIFLFLLLIILLYPIVIFILGYFPVFQHFTPNFKYMIGSNGHMNTRIKEIQEIDSVDILFLGSSHAYRGFDPRNFKNKKTFNLGSSSQTPLQTKILVERYLDKINPKLIIYEVYPDNFASDGVESSLDLIANDKNDLKSIKMALKINNLKTYNSLIYGIMADIFNLNKDYVEPLQRGEDSYIKGGYVSHKLQYYKFENYKKQEWVFRDYQIKAFEESLEMIKNKNIKVILVIAPITSNLYNSYTNNNYIDSTFNSYNLEYYNFNNLMELNDSLDFYDADHLNQIGVNKFNAKLLKILENE